MKLIKILLLILLLTGCSSINRKPEWTNSKESIFYIDKFKTGDVIIKNKVWYLPITWFGHSAVMVNKNDVGEYPRIGAGYKQLGVNHWLYEKRKVAVLRYKHFDEKFKKQFFINVSKNKNKAYRISFDKSDNKSFYCSKYIWYLFYKTAKDLGYEFHSGNHTKGLIFPYDFFNLNDFEEVDLR